MAATERKRALFARLVAEAAACRRCPAMCGRRAVLSGRNGDVGARVMFVGEAPGRQGGDRTRVPFSGDQSGRNFQRYIDSINLARAELFVTNAVLCNPRKSSGANRRPTSAEIANCSDYLRRLVELIDPAVIVTMGRVALEAVGRVAPHSLSLKESAGRVESWGKNRLLVPLYHPSPQVLASHRREAEQLADYHAVALAIKRTGAASTGREKDSRRRAGGATARA